MKKQYILTFLILIHVPCVFARHLDEIRSGNLIPDCPIVENDEDVVTLDEFTIPLNPIQEENSKSYGKTDDNGHIVRLNIVNEKFIPSTIFGLKYLEQLDIDNTCFAPCSHEQMPRDIQCLASSLTQLRIHNTKMTHLPNEIGKLIHLQILKLSNTGLRSLPDSIGDLSSLTLLYLPNNNLTSLPKTMKNLRSLKQIVLKNNPYLYSIHPLNGLPSLEILDAQHCSIKYLPHHLPQLINLYMTNNSLTKLIGTETLGNGTTKQKWFYFDQNSIRFISPRISQVKNLFYLNLNDNRLNNLPSNICTIPTLKHFFINNNFLNDNKLDKICIKFNSLFKRLNTIVQT